MESVEFRDEFVKRPGMGLQRLSKPIPCVAVVVEWKSVQKLPVHPKSVAGMTSHFWSKLRFGFQNPTKHGCFVGASRDGLARVLEVKIMVAPALF